MILLYGYAKNKSQKEKQFSYVWNQETHFLQMKTEIIKVEII